MSLTARSTDTRHASLLRLPKPSADRRLTAFLALLLLLQIRSDRVVAWRESPWSQAQGLRLLGLVAQSIRERFPHPPPDRILFESATDAMLKSLRDPYSEYFPPRVAELSEDLLQDRPHCGIGALVQFLPGQGIRIVRALRGGPAEEAGLAAGDLIVRVNAESVVDADPAKALDRLRGPLLSRVELTVLSGGEKTERHVTLSRRPLPLINAFRSLLIVPEEKIGYIRAPLFYHGLTNRVRDAVRALRGEGMRALLLDFRGNMGGALQEGTALADLFLADGIITIVERPGEDGEYSPQRRRTYRADREALDGFPLAILVDGETASAAELAAGALQKNGRAVLVGASTYGKARIQEVIPLPRTGAAIKLTIARYLTPDGKDIQGTGLVPDVRVTLTDRERAQLAQLLEAKWYDPEAEGDLLDSDTQLQEAVRVLRRRMGTGAPAAGEAEQAPDGEAAGT